MRRSALGLCLILTLIHGGDFSEPQPRPDRSNKFKIFKVKLNPVGDTGTTSEKILDVIKYMLLVPTVLKANNEQRFCLQLSHFNESVTVTVALETGKENITLLEKNVDQPGEDNCVTFKTPASDEARVGYITLEVAGNTLSLKKKRSVLIRPLENLVFIQTDKAIYKPGQKVQFRIAALDETFRAVSEKFPVIYVEDPQRNRIVQWLDVVTKKGIAEESFLLTSEPPMGTYNLVATRQRGSQIKQKFTVEEYVLPKFEVKVTVPSVITIVDEEVEVTVCGKYTYGKPVAGRIDIQVCRKFTEYSTCRLEERSVCEDFSHQADKTGCFSQVVKTKIFQLKRSGYEMKLVASAKITEEGTGVILTGEGQSDIKNTIAKVSFRQLDSHFKKGIPVYGQIFLEDADGKAIPDENVTIFVGYGDQNFTYTTGSDGTADFSIDTKSFPASPINLRAVYKTGEKCYSYYTLFPTYEEDSRSVNHFYSRTQNYIKIQPIYRTLSCEENKKFTVFYALSPEDFKFMTGVVFHHLVMAKGEIVDFGKNEVKLTSGQESHGQFTFNLPVNVNIAPMAKVLVYLVLESGEVIADSVSFKVENCFTNKVQLSFSANEALPGSQVDLTLFAQPNSLCALRGVDVSVSLLKPEAELTAKSIYDLLPVTELSGYNHGGHHLEEEQEDPCLKLDPIFMNGVYYTPSTPKLDTDTYTILKNLGLKVATNTMIRIPTICGHRNVVYYDYAPQASLTVDRGGPMPMRLTVHSESIMENVIETVRKLFPETWLWDLIEIDSIGHSNLKLTVPDSITTWKVGMFCTSEEDGFGLTQPVSLVTFQPFFLEVTVPYSAIRGETFNLKATVFNYLAETIRVNIGLEKSDEFIAKKISTDDEDDCIEANGKVTVSWVVELTSLGEVNFTISAQTLPGEGHCGNEIVNTVQGRKDTVIKSILVEPEGIEKEETQNAIICGTGPEISELISLKLPDNLVEGSARAFFSVIGDIMGTSMQNLGNLLQLPFGCGEQNMARFTPNIYILDYLNGTNQLTPAIKAKALSYLTTGYQTQMAYKHYDGSYSAFGPRSRGYGGDTGNTWLTAFVMKSFARAQSYIYIDPKHISDALSWLTRQQKDNGCFRNVGQLFHNSMKGGVDDEITLSAYITIALLEYPLPTTHIVVRNALFCLESALDNETSIYTQALMAQAFTLAGKMNLRARLLQSLEEKAIKKDDTVHWHRPELSDDSGRVRDPHRRAASIEVEMTSYVLLAMLSKPDVSTEDLTAASKIVSWLVEQQNPTGGFSSTPDTVVALQALALYGYHTVSHDGPREVTLTLDNAQVAKFTVEDSNRLLLQKVPLSSVSGEYTAAVTGLGCVYLQTSLKYNVPHPEGEAAFNISVSTVPEICTIKSLKSFNIKVNVSYIGKRENSNMALVEIKLPSGYTPDKSSVKQLQGRNLISRTEAHPNKVIVYFEKLGKDVKSFTFSVEQEIPVGNLRAATATILDYYETDDIAVTKYFHPCSNNGDGAKSTE